MKKKRQKIVIIGCGNLAWHLAKQFSQLKTFEVLVYNHKPNKALALFKTRFGCGIYNNLENIASDASFYFICVADKFIASVSRKIKASDPASLILHTSGSIGIREIGSAHSGVFYPLQTFSKEDVIRWAEIPILVETNKPKDLGKLERLARLFSEKVVAATTAERSKVHLAAVLVNNFTNALYVSADELLAGQPKNKDLNFKLLLPLVEQTAVKLKRISPLAAQTGPAKRNDKVVMKKQLASLKKDKSLKKIYKQLSALIADQQKNAYAKL